LVQRPPGASRALLEQRSESGDVLGREKDRQPPVGDFAAEGDVFRADRGRIDRDLWLYWRDRQFGRLTRSVGEGERDRPTVKLDPLARERHSHDGDVLACALELFGKALAVPTFGDLGTGRAEAEAEATI